MNRNITTKGIMRSEGVVFLHVGLDALAQFLWRIVLVDVDIVIFQGSEKAFSPDIIQCLAFAIH